VVCPEGLPGPTLVGIPAPTGPYCIDSTEVTVEQYQKFVATQPSLAGQPASCAFNTSVGEAGDPDTKTARKPMLVNWCNAWLYCAWAGKRLCGRIVDGGPVDYDVGYDDPEQSECSRSGRCALFRC
jgi:formylglycine-generating enzyme